MQRFSIDFSPTGMARVYLGTLVGVLVTIAVAFVLDSFSFETMGWIWGEKPINNVTIPIAIATPVFYFFLLKQRELAIAHAELMNVASTDALTQCLNRHAFTRVVEAYLDRMTAGQVAEGGAMVMVDIDHFKAINDRFGHDWGDEALSQVAASVKAAVRPVDLVGRIGGEEFGLFLPGADSTTAEVVSERVRSAIEGLTFSPGGERHAISASLGAAVFEGARSFKELYREADVQLYEAKHKGRNRTMISALRGG